MGRSSNQCVVPIHIDRKLGLFSFSKYYRVNTRFSKPVKREESKRSAQDYNEIKRRLGK